eukprot:m.15925 g.15925  ORF g.15925 m.15925 type:complete len:135 (-) comp10788_c0_seq1:28-432(-)
MNQMFQSFINGHGRNGDSSTQKILLLTLYWGKMKIPDVIMKTTTDESKLKMTEVKTSHFIPMKTHTRMAKIPTRTSILQNCHQGEDSELWLLPMYPRQLLRLQNDPCLYHVEKRMAHATTYLLRLGIECIQQWH